MNNVTKKSKTAKSSLVETPDWLADEIYNRCEEIRLNRYYPFDVVDLCCGSGSLSRPFLRNNYLVCGYDIDSKYESLYPGGFCCEDILNSYSMQQNDLVLMNPPWNGYKPKYAPELFFRRALDFLDRDGFIVMITQNNFYNEGRKRFKWLNDEITVFKILFLPFHNVFKDVHQACGVIFACRKEYEGFYKNYHEIAFLTEPDNNNSFV